MATPLDKVASKVSNRTPRELNRSLLLDLVREHAPLSMLSAFAYAGVRYLVIGGHAVSLHARPRTTKDLDL
jgi:hypothetical protein